MRKYGTGLGTKNAIDILNERYARGDIQHDEYVRMKLEINNLSGRDAQPVRNHSLRQPQRERGRKILKFGQGSQE